MTSTVVHDTFVLEREYPVAPELVFAAFADPDIKGRWFAGGDGWAAIGDHTFDFRVGGREYLAGGGPDRPVSTFDAIYHDIVEDERIIYSYAMTLDGAPLSVSLTTIEIAPTATGARLRMTEHGAFFDGGDGPASRLDGTGQLLDAIGAMFAADLAEASGAGGVGTG